MTGPVFCPYAGGIRLRRFWREGQSKYRDTPPSGDVQPAWILRIRQVKRLAMFAAIDFGVAPPSLFDITTLPLQHIGQVKPPFQMPATRLAFFVFLVAGALPRRFNFYFVMRELLGC